MRDSYYDAPITEFLCADIDAILGKLATAHNHDLDILQRNAWADQILFLKRELSSFPEAHLFIEFSIPRMGKRADCVLLLGGIVFVLEFKVGADTFDRSAIDQTHDYALDLKNFHLGSHPTPIVPILISTKAAPALTAVHWADDQVAQPLRAGSEGLAEALNRVLDSLPKGSPIDVSDWRKSGYRPTPTIIEAAEALYQSHNVLEIARSDAGAKNLQATSQKIAQIIESSKANNKKSICFVTGVPGAGKTLAGLNIAALRAEKHEDEHAVYLSGNGPLVLVLSEALARDQVARGVSNKAEAKRSVKRFLQNIHHFRDFYVSDPSEPFEKVVVFDEAQRAWTKEQASKFMQSKKGVKDFEQSEPDFLIGVMDRHKDWCTIVCLIGGGQEINTGEAGLNEWLSVLQATYPDWEVHCADALSDPHYAINDAAIRQLADPSFQKHHDLHLSVSMRSFRAERLSSFVSEVLNGNPEAAASIYNYLSETYPIYLTRRLDVAKEWLKARSRGTERIGVIASSGAHRLRPEGIHVKESIDPAHWFLDDKDDVRSSFALEQAATEFDIQGLELDWSCVAWDADLRFEEQMWKHYSFKGTKWMTVRAEERKSYLVNAYRVLLTRARQGMIIFIPTGHSVDATRSKSFYDQTYTYLRSCGIDRLEGYLDQQ